MTEIEDLRGRLLALEARYKSRWGRVWGWAGSLGTIGFVGVAVTLLIVFNATNRQVELANAKMADLLIRIGAAEARALEAEQRVEAAERATAEYERLLPRMKALDLQEVEHVIDLLERPGLPELVDLQAVKDELRQTSLMAQIVFAAAYAATEPTYARDQGALRDALAAVWATSPHFRNDESRATRSVRYGRMHVNLARRKGGIIEFLYHAPDGKVETANERALRESHERVLTAIDDALQRHGNSPSNAGD